MMQQSYDLSGRPVFSLEALGGTITVEAELLLLSEAALAQWAGQNSVYQAIAQGIVSYRESLSPGQLDPDNPNYFLAIRPDLAEPEPPPPTPEQLSGFRFALITSPLYRAYMDGIAGQSPTLAAGIQDAIALGNLAATIALWNTIVNLAPPPGGLIDELRGVASAHGIPFVFCDSGEIA